MEDFATKALITAASVFVLAYTVALGMKLHDAWVSSQQFTGGN
jgi:hypothetical protein